MKVLLSWINDYVDTSNLALNQITKGLTDAGFEVEEIIDKSKGLDKVVVSLITKITRHPNADKLVICQADYGYGKTQIVTHADNMKVGDYVPLALDGANLPNGCEIKNGSLRGVESNGMFCSGDELGIDNSIYPGAEVDGLLILQGAQTPGTPIADVLGLNEVVLDVNVLPNRADCNSIYGIAKEISAIFDLPLKELDLTYKKGNSNKLINVDIQDIQLCPRYMSCVVENVKNGSSPDWMQKRLSLLGHTPHSLFVDITNYVLLEVGQPMHAFDLSKIKGEQIIVRRAKNGEKLLTLDEKEHKLSENNLVIANADEPMVIAGIMGGMESGTYETTKDVMLESANFNYANIRRSAHALGLLSDSSIRYSKGVNVENAEIGLNRALNIITKLGVGEISVVNDNHLEFAPAKTVISKVQNINDRLGLKIDTDTMLNILNRLGIKTTEENGVLTSIIPPERTDIERECDICEEVGRIYGLDNISIDDSTATDFSTVGELTVEQKNIFKLKSTCALNGFYETLTWQFGSPKLITNAGLNLDEHIKIANPIGLDYSVVRTNLAPGMLNTISFNLKQGNKNLKLFELARVFKAKSLPLDTLPDEHENLCLSLTGNYDFFYLKNLINKIFASIGIKFEYRQAQNNMFHPGICADIYLYNRKIGEIGEIHPKVRSNFEINQKVMLAEINLGNIINRLNDRHNGKAPEKLPYIERDLALVVDINTPASKLIEVALKADKENIADCKIFDVYMSEQIGIDKKSIAFKISIRQGEKPLQENEIASIVEKVINAEKETLNAVLR